MNGGELAGYPDETPDEALLVAFANGDSSAGRVLVANLAPRMLGYSTRILGNRPDAEDVVQEAMIRLWKIAPDWRQGEAKVSTWLFKVVVNLCTDRLRAQKREKQVDLASVSDPISTDPSALARMTDRKRVESLDAALATLPDRQRQAVVLRHLEGMSNPEIAAVMGIGVEAVESLTARGKRALTSALAGRKDELGFDHG